MKVQIENLICEWESESTTEVFVRFCNLILLQRDRHDLERALKFSPYRSVFEKNFIWEFGAHHFWVNQRKPYSGEPMEKRLLIVEL
ncbi:MAG: hypothetical protein J6I37_00640 [Prevotella sp.]|nr:hypothetical protein [Prevotella sp.]